MNLSSVAVVLALGANGCSMGQSPTAAPSASSPVAETSFRQFTGMADASAGLSLGEDWFMAVTDEFNLIGFYRWSKIGKPLKTMDISSILGIDPQGKSPEADMEGLARVGDTVFGITSHGRNKDGKFRPNRHRLFALKVTDGSGDKPPVLIGHGKPFEKLAEAIVAAPEFASLGLSQSLQLDTDKKGKMKDYIPLAPKDEGFNVEGLAATPVGHLLIGLRNPMYQNKAIVLPLTNPREVCENAAKPAFAAPFLLNLGGRAIRSLEWLPAQNSYGISAGPSAAEGDFAFYLWKGTVEDTPRQVKIPNWPQDNFKAEGFFADAKGSLFFLSDDGTLPVNGAEQKSLPLEAQFFRAFSCELPSAK